MDVNVITQLITTVGFPIAACIALFWQSNKQSETFQDALEQQRQEHASEMAKVTEAINNNTIALNRLLERSEQQ